MWIMLYRKWKILLILLVGRYLENITKTKCDFWWPILDIQAEKNIIDGKESNDSTLAPKKVGGIERKYVLQIVFVKSYQRQEIKK